MSQAPNIIEENENNFEEDELFDMMMAEIEQFNAEKGDGVLIPIPPENEDSASDAETDCGLSNEEWCKLEDISEQDF